MANSEDFQTVAMITTTLSTISIICATLIIITASKRKKKDKENEDYLVNDYVLYMSMCDLCVHIIALIYYSAVAAKSDWISKWHISICWIVGFIFQFSLISSSTWSFAIAMNLFWLINGSDPDKLIPKSVNMGCNIYIKRHKVYILLISLICTLIPCADYGFTPNDEQRFGTYIILSIHRYFDYPDF